MWIYFNFYIYLHVFVYSLPEPLEPNIINLDDPEIRAIWCQKSGIQVLPLPLKKDPLGLEVHYRSINKLCLLLKYFIFFRFQIIYNVYYKV